MWGVFIAKFCKVEFLCYQGTPNWLGYVFLFAAVCFLVIGYFFAWLFSLRNNIERYHEYKYEDYPGEETNPWYKEEEVRWTSFGPKVPKDYKRKWRKSQRVIESNERDKDE